MIRLRLRSELPDYLRDAEEVARAFDPAAVLDADADDELFLSANLSEDGVFRFRLRAPFFQKEGEKRFFGNLLSIKKYSKRYFKNLLYDALSEATGVSLPYGSLTGVRPTKLFYELEAAGEDAENVIRAEFRVAEEKASLIRETVRAQKAVYDFKNDGIDLFLNVPFCPTRCAYCSFLSAEYPKIEKFVPAYLEAARRELFAFSEYLSLSGRPLRAVYIGGGTPTVLPPDGLRAILETIPRPFREFTVEAGRPDTITEEKLDVLKRYGATRVSVNPQTMTDSVLTKVGRKHTVQDALEAFRRVASFGFSINADFIAGLDGETLDSFRSGIETVAALAPDNLTVHTLSVKRGSALAEAGARKGQFGSASAMVNAAREILTASGYRPYYLYRQKNMTDNLENVGYALNGKASYYNVDIMEETTDIYGVGAGAMSKKVNRAENRIDRLANPKGLPDYLARTEEILEKKRKFFIKSAETE